MLVFVLFSGCSMADLRPTGIRHTGLVPDAERQGRALLDAAWERQGFAHLEKRQTYTIVAEDHWKGMMGRMGKVWPESKSSLRLNYAIGSFDGQVTFLDGKARGLTAGLQSWQYYEEPEGGALEFRDEANERIAFGLSAYQYFFELADRLRRAPIMTYAGEKEWKGQRFDLVFVTWDRLESHMEHDQYLLWISRDTGLLEYAEYTLRDNYLRMPGSKIFYGSIHFTDFRDIDGILVPFVQYIFVNSPRKSDSRYVHRMTVSDFAFDEVPVATLRKDPSITYMGDAKPE